MDKPDILKSNGILELTVAETNQIRGGNIVSYLTKFAGWGATYFFNMGVQEGKRMRAQM